VGTEADRKKTEAHNATYPDRHENAKILNANVTEWLLGTVKIPDDGVTRRPDTFSVYARYMRCLLAPNYTVFSNTASQNKWIEDHCKDPSSSHYVVSLESPHNEIHLSVGGFYQKGNYNASPIRGANGDMGDNQTAGFDPIFFFHHCFIDYIFSLWQRLHNRTKRGDLTIIKDYPGTFIENLGQPPNFPLGIHIDMSTPLYPFKNPSGRYYTSEDATDLNEFGIAYGIGSFNAIIPEVFDRARSPFDIISPQLSDPMILAGSNPNLNGVNPFSHIIRVRDISRNQYKGSFVIRLYARLHDGKEVEVGREPVLSRWNIDGCRNCQNHLKVTMYVPIDAPALELLKGPVGLTGQKAEINWVVKIQTHDKLYEFPNAGPDEDRAGEMIERPKVGYMRPKVDYMYSPSGSMDQTAPITPTLSKFPWRFCNIQ